MRRPHELCDPQESIIQIIEHIIDCICEIVAKKCLVSILHVLLTAAFGKCIF